MSCVSRVSLNPKHVSQFLSSIEILIEYIHENYSALHQVVIETSIVSLVMHPEGKVADETLLLLKDPNDEEPNKCSLFVKQNRGDLPEFAAFSHTI